MNTTVVHSHANMSAELSVIEIFGHFCSVLLKTRNSKKEISISQDLLDLKRVDRVSVERRKMTMIIGGLREGKGREGRRHGMDERDGG